MSTFEQVRGVLAMTLQLGDRQHRLTPESELFGGIPEFDSMAVLAVVTALEEQFDLLFDDEDISEESFKTVGNLVALVDSKLAA